MSNKLIFMYGLVLLAVVGSVSLLLAVVFGITSLNFHLIVGGGLLAVILGSMLYRSNSLKGGGAAIAVQLGGKMVSPQTKDPKQRVLFNVVEEMSIASGISTPMIFILPDEAGINAFAAGLSPTKAAIGVTQGALDTLSRDELQGVIAHEFSHIFNGDMKLNVKLISLLGGISAIYTTGAYILRGMRYSRRGSRRDGRAEMALLLVGLGFMAIGSIGVLLSRILKSAISRQREFLADATAVQYTRNPMGIAGALLKIRDNTGSVVASPYAEETSHMFFGSVKRLSSIFATHPALEDRVKKISPQILAQYPAGTMIIKPNEGSASDQAADTLSTQSKEEARQETFKRAAVMSSTILAATVNSDANQELEAEVGCPTETALESAKDFLSLIPITVREATRTITGAKALVSGIFLSADEVVQENQKKLVLDSQGAAFLEYVETISQELSFLKSRFRLPLVELTLPALRDMGKDDQRKFLKLLGELSKADGQIHVFEFAIITFLNHQLDLEIDKTQTLAYLSSLPAQKEAQILISALLLADHHSTDQATKEFEKLQLVFRGAQLNIKFDRVLGQSPSAIEKALTRLRGLKPLEKQKLFKICVRTVLSNKNISEHQFELLQVVCATLEMPLPFCPKSIKK